MIVFTMFYNHVHAIRYKNQTDFLASEYQWELSLLEKTHKMEYTSTIDYISAIKGSRELKLVSNGCYDSVL